VIYKVWRTISPRNVHLTPFSLRRAVILAVAAAPGLKFLFAEIAHHHVEVGRHLHADVPGIEAVVHCFDDRTESRAAAPGTTLLHVVQELLIAVVPVQGVGACTVAITIVVLLAGAVEFFLVVVVLLAGQRHQ